MAEITIIAGPPGIGKTSASETILFENELYLNEDYFYLKYKEQNTIDPAKAGSNKFTKEIATIVNSGKNFGYETNLGYAKQYEDLKKLIIFKPENVVHLHLFFTENVSLCWDRAEKRLDAGGHYVSNKTIFQMYNNTFPLLKVHVNLFFSINLYDVKEYGAPDLILSTDRAGQILFKKKEMPNWATKHILAFLEERAGINKRSE